jgi:hypothetical protein
MRKTLLAVGLVIMLVGVFVLNEGVQVVIPFAELAGLVSHVQTEKVLVSTTLLTVAASSYSFLPVDLNGGVKVMGSLQVGAGQEVGFYVMDEGNFTMWRASQPSSVLLARPTAISYNFTITPKTSGTYYFVFDNADTTRRVVIFSLSTLQNVTVLNPVVDYLGYLIFALGIVLFTIGARTGKRKPKIEAQIKREVVAQPVTRPATVVRCKFCGAEVPTGEKFCAKCGRAQQ